ncbi:MAG: hypothetical protein Q8P39_03595 [Candidatus Yanofskybacteria bacterium]|nr:hypothetical protein [Candidatus Yanofskybacteria bacterium]
MNREQESSPDASEKKMKLIEECVQSLKGADTPEEIGKILDNLLEDREGVFGGDEQGAEGKRILGDRMRGKMKDELKNWLGEKAKREDLANQVEEHAGAWERPSQASSWVTEHIMSQLENPEELFRILRDHLVSELEDFERTVR